MTFTRQQSRRRKSRTFLRIFQVALGQLVSVCDLTCVVSYLNWLNRRDWSFGINEGYPGHLNAAMWTSGVGFIGGVLWLAIALCDRCFFQTVNEPRPVTGIWRKAEPKIQLVLLMIAMTIFALSLTADGD